MTHLLEKTHRNLLVIELVNHFQDKSSFLLSDIVHFYRIYDSDVEKSTVQWRVSRLMEIEIIQRIGRGKYSLGKQKTFKPYLTSRIKKVYHHLISKYFESEYCIWSTKWFEEYLPKMEVEIIFLEAERNLASGLSFYLWEKKDGTVFYKLPIITKLFGTSQVIVRRRISGSPQVKSGDIYYASLEKIIVDMYCDWNKIYQYKSPTFYIFFKKLNNIFSINETICGQVEEKESVYEI